MHTGWKTASSAIPADPVQSQTLLHRPSMLDCNIPEPNSLARVDSFLKSFEPPAGTAIGDIVADEAIDNYARDREESSWNWTGRELG